MTNQAGGLTYKWKVLLSVVFGTFMIILDTTVVNVAFPTLRGEFGATLEGAQWILSIYVLALGIGTPLAGYFADRFGIKYVYITGLSIFVLGSLSCGLAPNLGSLIAARALQGVGGGLAQPLGTALLFSAFPTEEQGKAFGYYGIVLLVAPALGPILGGWLVDLNLWRAIFWINVPIGIIGVGLAWAWLRKPDAERGAEAKLDPVGLTTAVIGFGAVLYAASIAERQGWTAAPVLIWFAVGGVALLIFGAAEIFFAKDPLLNLRLFQIPTFAVAAIVGYIAVVALFGAEFLLPIYLQTLRGQSALQSGLYLLPLAITAGIVTPISGRLYDIIGPRPLAVTGFLVLTVNTWQLSLLDANTSFGWLIFLLALRGFALGCTLQPTFTASLGAIPKRQLPRGSSLVNGTRRLVQSISVAVLATILAGALSPQVTAMRDQAQAGGGQAGGEVPALCAPSAPAMLQQACDEYLVGLESAYRVTFYFAILAAIAAAFLPGWPFAWEGRQSQAGQQGRASPAD